MASVAEVSELLGHSWDGVKSTGRPAFIRKHLEEFAQQWSCIKNQEMRANFFLVHHGKKLFSHPECSLKLQENRDEWVYACGVTTYLTGIEFADW